MSSRPSRKYEPEARAYEVDFHAWADEQAGALRRLEPAGVDWPNIVEELEGMARSDERALESYLAVLLLHLLKWRYQPDKRCGSWEASIENSRDQIDGSLRRSPSLASKLNTAFESAYPLARRRAGAQMGWRRDQWNRLPATCEWSLERVRDRDFWPD
jgi:hypothetical protein